MFVLYVASKNYSSWSLRAWLLLRALDIAFDERVLTLFSSEFRREVAEHSPAGRVPVLLDDGVAVWDSLAIAEYVAERYPASGVWPIDRLARARARSLCAEMHAGFGALRTALPMNIEASLPGVAQDLPVRQDIARIIAIWQEQRARHRREGEFLFGRFTAADAFFAPVVSRFVTYDVDVPAASRDYMQTVLGLPAMREWIAAALAEHNFIAEEEPYRSHR